jgi:transcriptional regulator with XRE-family HTH domain
VPKKPPPGPAPKTPALAKLEKWLGADSRRTSADLAKALGVTNAAVSQIRARKIRPSHELRVLFRLAVGIPEEDWDTEAEKSERAKREAAASAFKLEAVA